ncbi:MAG: hypothetical protein H7067_05185 [Burkholderiales bacterium]|nr:hypothetical protein [Opitutaceae bacterium]
MSLNRHEQMIQDYLRARPDELSHWREVVTREARRAADPHEAALVLERELWRYFEERAAVAEPFRGLARREGLARTSLRNLAELLLRLWVAPSPKPKSSDSGIG